MDAAGWGCSPSQPPGYTDHLDLPDVLLWPGGPAWDAGGVCFAKHLSLLPIIHLPKKKKKTPENTSFPKSALVTFF